MASRDVPKWVTNALEDLRSSIAHCATLQKDKDLPPVFQKATQWLTITKEVLKCVKKQHDSKKLDTTKVELCNQLRITKDLTDIVESILGTLAEAPEKERTKQYRSVLEHRKVPSLEAVLLKHFEALKKLADAKLIEVTEEQTKQLTAAIEELKKLSPEVEQDGKNVFHHSGVGDMFNALGGKQYNYKGSGDQNNADTVNSNKKKE